MDTSPKEPDNITNKPAVPKATGIVVSPPAGQEALQTNNPAIPKPTGIWGTILTTTPIVLTVLATAFAGLSSSEMTLSMYYRSLAAQHQAKAGSQWGFFQAKRIRGTSLEMTIELLQSLAQPELFDPETVDTVLAQILQLLKQAPDDKKSDAAKATEKIETIRKKLATLLAADTAKQSLPYLKGAAPPAVEMRTLPKKEVQQDIDTVVDAIGQRKTEGETATLVAKVHPNDIEAATRLAEEDADLFDTANKPINKTFQDFRALLAEVANAVRPFRKSVSDRPDDRSPPAQVSALFDQLNNSFKAASLDYQAKRYQQEALFNRHAAEMYEVRVRRSGVASDLYRERSKKFFYSMLLAQAGVTIASLALARTQHSLLWLLAALAGVIALGFSTYVYLLS